MSNQFDEKCACLEAAGDDQNLVPTDDEFKQLALEGICQIVAGGGGGAGAAPFELLVDEGNADTIFIRVYDNLGTGFTDYNIDGTVYGGLVGPVSPYGGTAAAGSITTETVTFPEAAFSNVQFIGTNASGFVRHYVDTTSAYIVEYFNATYANTRDVEFNEDYTEVYALTATNIVTVDYSDASVINNAAISGLTPGFQPFHITLHPHTNELWLYAGAGGSGSFFILDPTTGVATLIAVSSYTQNTTNSGLSFDFKGRLYSTLDNSTRSIREVIYVEDNAVTSPVQNFTLGDTLTGLNTVSLGLRAPFTFTARNTFISAAYPNNNMGEFDFSGTLIRGMGGSVFGNACSYFNPFGTREAYVGAPIRRVSVYDSAGALLSTSYYTSSGTDITAAIEQQDVGLVEFVDFDAPRAAIHLSGNLAFGSVSTTYATLINVDGTPNQNGGTKIFQVYNDLDTDVYVSWRNIGNSTDQLIVPSGSSMLIDYQANNLVAAGTLLVRSIGGNPTTGNIYACIIR